ncbi:hypothetical protein HOK51_07910 [Candidatus Woesearchaeota archaeon]|jgi:hypothetical protein|nr:hypothetical protein [Candidatus Woesearchaeota archaeon]MBT6519750.1 hypothetical protein [Candidatus Woesearchaeota archaeon]MBT7368130.1 hypothetical protein [Candidatus Woesearchaeota archaeon]
MTQTQTNTNLALKKLKGIKSKGVKVKSKSSLEKLLEVHKTFMDEFKTAAWISSIGALRTYFNTIGFANYQLRDCEFSEFDLESFIQVIGSSYIPNSDLQSRFNGAYSGALLSILTERNKEQNKRNFIYIDGTNIKFDNLFLETKHADVVIVNDLSGNDICSQFALGGSATLLGGMYLSGNSIFHCVGNCDSVVGAVIGKVIYGTNLLNSNFTRGGLGTAVVLDDIYGSHVGNHFAWAGGYLGVLAARTVDSYRCFDNLCNVKKIIGVDIEGRGKFGKSDGRLRRTNRKHNKHINLKRAEPMFEYYADKYLLNTLLSLGFDLNDRDQVLELTQPLYNHVRRKLKK